MNIQRWVGFASDRPKITSDVVRNGTDPVDPIRFNSHDDWVVLQILISMGGFLDVLHCNIKHFEEITKSIRGIHS